MRTTACARLLGGFELRVGDREMPSPASSRVESLLALLLLRGTAPLTRREAAALLWPESTEAQARTNLRHVLHSLRHSWPELERYVEITPSAVRRRPGAPVELDVVTFERLLDADREVGGPADSDQRMHQLREALRLYRGELLEGRDDEWLIDERSRLRRRAQDALGELVALCAEHGALAEGIARAETLVNLDPLREEPYRHLIRMHDLRGDRARAVQVYHVCSSVLDRELGVQPSAATRATYEALLPAHPDEGSVAQSVRSPLVGRRRERAHLVDLWRAAEAGAARLVLAQGEPGVGKTRLTEDLAAWCRHRGGRVADARCYPAEGTLAYGPVVEWLSADTVRAAVRRLVPRHVTEIARILPEVLLERPDAASPTALTESEQRMRLFQAVAAAVLGEDRPTLLVLDDLPYVDRETCRLLHYLLRSQGARLLVVATARRDDVELAHHVGDLIVGMKTRDRFTEIELDPLDRGETSRLAEQLSGTPLSAEESAALFAETEGNPLFVLETLSAGWRTQRRLSPRVQSVIEARIARLTKPARDLADLAATIGRGFDVDVLRVAAMVDEETLAAGLDELWRRRILRERSGGDGDSYDFSHGKLREVAAELVPPARRRLLHRRVAAALETLHADEPGPVSAQIAVHHEGAGAAAIAITWYRRAARAAQVLHAHHDAIRLLDRALHLIAGQPTARTRDAVELELVTDRLVPLVEATGYASGEMSATQQRALALAADLGLEPSAPLLRSLALAALTRSEFDTAARHGRVLEQIAGRRSDPVLLVEASYVLGIAAFWQAQLDSAREHFERAVARYRPANRMTHLLAYGQDPKVVCLGRLANTLWFLGHAPEAEHAADRALRWADEIGHPFSRTIARTFAALLALDMDDEPTMRTHLADMEEADQETVSGPMVIALRGYVDVLDGERVRGVCAVRTEVDKLGPIGAAPGQAAILARILLAACLAADDEPGARAAAQRLLGMAGPARLWAPVARRVVGASPSPA